MKKKIFFPWLCAALLATALLTACNYKYTEVEATILINGTDVTAIQFEYGGVTFLEDIKTNAAQWKYLEDHRTVTLTVKHNLDSPTRIELYMFNRQVAAITLEDRVTERVSKNINEHNSRGENPQ